MAVYLDHNATTPVLPDVITEMASVLAYVGNPSSIHGHGRTVRDVVEKARNTVAEALSVPAEWVTFTSGGTEANNMAFKFCEKARPEGAILVSAVEHDSVLQVAPAGRREIIPVDHNGIIDLQWLRQRILGKSASPVAMVSIMRANNETGVLQPVAAVADILHEYPDDARPLLHCDAVQAFGKVAVSDLGIDICVVSAHKIGGPMGVGAIVFRDSLQHVPLIRGGGQERRRRSGTENVAGIAGFAKAVALRGDCTAFQAQMRALSQQMLAGLRNINDTRGTDVVYIHGQNVDKVPNTFSLELNHLGNDTQLMMLDLAGVSVSAGSACSSGKVTPSHVLMAMGLSEERARCALRVSMGWSTTAQDVDLFLQKYRVLAEKAAHRRVPINA
jgi:cysteine desulfurase